MQKVLIYSKENCPYCLKAKAVLKQRGVHDFEEILIDSDEAAREVMIEHSDGRKTVPQIFIGDVHIGGCDDLLQLDKSGELLRLLNRA